MAETQLVSFGKRLKLEREKRHWTQEHLAERIGGSVPSINRWEHDRATPRQDVLALLTELFGRPPEQWGTARQVYWNVPFLRNPYFTGRERILSRLHQALAGEQTVALTQPRAISGLGGIGKTQTAIEYAYRYAEEYEAVLWVRADSTEALVSDFAALASVLGLPTRQERDQHYVVSTVRRWLEEHGPWLLIFDNADDPALVSDFLPRRAAGAVLLTTRSQATGPHIKKIELEKISREEGIAFLLRRVHADDEERVSVGMSQQDREASEQLWECMEGLPLALDQAAAYIEETGCTISDYLALFKTRSAQLLRLRGQGASAHPEPVATTWRLTFEKVEHANPAAAELLRCCAFLHPDEIPEAMLIAGASALGPIFQSIAADELEWNKAIGELRKYSLLKRDAEKKILNIHRLVQAVIKESMDHEALRQWAEGVVQAVNAAFPEVKHDTWSQCEQLLTQALMAAQWIEQYHFTTEEASRLLHETATYLQERARYQEAEPLYRRALRIRQQQLGVEHPDVASSLNGLAILYWKQGRYAEAEPLYRQALYIREQQLGPEHPDVATTLNGLAVLYDDQGKYAEAEPLYLRALHIREQELGLEDSLVATSLNNLAISYLDQGRYAEAEPLYLRALHIHEQQLGPEHSLVAISLNNLAIFYLEQGKYAEVEPLYLRAIRIYEKQQWGAEHPGIAYPLNNLADLYREQGRYAEAEPLYQRALRIREEQLGPEHPQLAYPLTGLANLYREQGRYAEAEILYQRALRIREQQLGLDHPETAATLHDFATFEEIRGNQQEARSLYQRALNIREQTLGTGHPKTVETRTRLIALLHAMGQHEEATRLEKV